MSWAFLAVLFSGWLYVDASYRGPSWQRWLFKPLTLLLLLLLGWNAPQLGPSGYFILCGLLATLIADALLLLPRERMLYAIGALFLSQLLYTIGFASGMTMTLYWPPLLILLAIGVVLLAIIWGEIGYAALAGRDLCGDDVGDGLGGGGAILRPRRRSGLLPVARRLAAAVSQ